MDRETGRESVCQVIEFGGWVKRRCQEIQMHLNDLFETSQVFKFLKNSLTFDSLIGEGMV